MSNQSTHGGRREGAGPHRKMVEPVRTTITLEAAHLAELKRRYGAGWQNVLRELVAAHLHAA